MTSLWQPAGALWCRWIALLCAWGQYVLDKHEWGLQCCVTGHAVQHSAAACACGCRGTASTAMYSCERAALLCGSEGAALLCGSEGAALLCGCKGAALLCGCEGAVVHLAATGSLKEYVFRYMVAVKKASAVLLPHNSKCCCLVEQSLTYLVCSRS